jgi:transcriptional regulator with XRE-family HTH domain
LAEAIGIEQSYLSKLENDKSIPSADIFQAILKALSVDVGSFLEGIDEKIIHRQLRQIPEVANYLNAGVAYKIHNIKKWLFGSAAACVIGLTLIVAGYKGLVFSNQQFNYESPGVILANEPIEMLNNTNHMFEWLGLRDFNAEDAKILREFQRKRVRPEYMLSDEYRGKSFNIPVEGGSRSYYLSSDRYVERPANRWLMLSGTFLTFLGIFGFFVEFRLRKI